jgi:hypothetical protein
MQPQVADRYLGLRFAVACGWETLIENLLA